MPRPAGAIDTLWTGFDVIHHHLWLLLLPIAIDAFLWFGPQLSLGSVVDTWAASVASPQSRDDLLVRTVDEATLDWLRGPEGLKRFNLLSLTALSSPYAFQQDDLLRIFPLRSGVPSFRAYAPGNGPLIPLESEGIVSAAVVSILALGVVLAALYYSLLGQLVREEFFQPRRYLADLPFVIAALAAFFGLVIMAIGLPMGAIFAITLQISPTLAQVVGPILGGVLLWAFVYLFFATDAVFVSRSSPTHAVHNSVLLVRSHFWPAMGFIALFLIVSAGFPYVWEQVATSLRAPGVVLAIVGHNYISSGLAAASMTYYKERFERMIASHEGSSSPTVPTTLSQ
jgi:hypothetical protein